MRITDVRVHLLDLERPRAVPEMFAIPGATRVQFDRRSRAPRPDEAEPDLLPLIRVETDDGKQSVCETPVTAGPARAFALAWVDAFRRELVGCDPLDRERVYQILWFANRFKWIHPWMMSYADVLLWDLAGKAACMPIAGLLGRFRQRIPAYVSSPNYAEPEAFVTFGRQVKEAGFKGYKLHSRLGPDADIAVARAVREALGPEMILMHDPVQTYTYPEALRVGRASRSSTTVGWKNPCRSTTSPR